MFVTCKFHREATRTYTYTYDGEEALEPGVAVEVLTPKDGVRVVYVADIDVPEPAFTCKPILGLAPSKEPVEAAEGDEVQP